MAVLAGLTAAGSKYIDGDHFGRALARFNWLYALPILGLTVAYMLVKGWRFVGHLRSLTPARPGVVLVAYLAGQACTVLPWGIGARAALLKETGVPVEHSAAAISLSSLSDQAVLLFFSLLAALWFEPARRPAETVLTVLLIGSVLLGIEGSRVWLFSWLEKLLGRMRLLDFWRGFLESLRNILRGPLLIRGVLNAALAFALMVMALDFAARGTGAAVPAHLVVLAFTLPAMLGRLSAMPAGVGVTDAGMISILNQAPGVTLDQAAAATLIFRVGTVFFAALLGGAVYLLVWRGSEVKRERALHPAA